MNPVEFSDPAAAFSVLETYQLFVRPMEVIS